MRCILKKGIIYLWLISILVNAFPVGVLATFLKKEEISSLLEEQQAVEEKTVKVVGEVLEKRKLNEKHYLLSDGSIKAYIYPEDIHYEENGELVEIDNTFVPTRDGFKNKKSSIMSEFLKEENCLKITHKGHTITWKMLGIEKKDAQVFSSSVSKFSLNSKASLESRVIYPEVLKNIKLEYEVVSNRIEENIILDTKESIQNEFHYFLQVGDLTLKQEKENELIFLDKDQNIVFYITAPVMYDSNLEFSSDITLTPKKVDGGYEITLVASKKWLEEEERVYPVTIDPIIATSPNRDDIVDTYIYPNDASNTGKGNAHILRVGSTSYSDINTNRNPFRSLIKFSLPNLKSGDQVIDAELHIFNYQDTDSWNPPSGNVQIDIHAVTKDWNESNAYWNNMKDAYDKNHIVDYIKYSYDTKDANKENTADITSLVKIGMFLEIIMVYY